MDIPKVNSEIHFVLIKLQLQPCTIQRLVKCEINVEELEFVPFPQTDAKTSSNSTLLFNKMGATPTLVFKKQDGIKMIAKMVERLLLGLHIKIKSVIIIFEQATHT